MADHNEAEVLYRLGQLRQRYVQMYGRLTYKGHVMPDRRTVAMQNYEHIVKAQMHYMIRDLDDLFGIKALEFEVNPPALNYPPNSHYKPKRRR